VGGGYTNVYQSYTTDFDGQKDSNQQHTSGLIRNNMDPKNEPQEQLRVHQEQTQNNNK
jgi:hypothetical protein